MWKRRASILCQLGYKRETDLGLLYACIEPSLSSKEFFLRKAIGWALRQYAWTDPREVRRYVKANRERLSGLSIREAMKNI
jgi:3-methyladenine DNA glycosylase AlkD